MAKLYIANCKKQDFMFTYMLRENPKPYVFVIRAGTQHAFEHDKDDLQQIVDQHGGYGMMEADKCRKGFGGLCYRFDKPISVEAIEMGLSQSDQEAIERSLNARKLTAAAADQVLEQKAAEVGARQVAPLSVEVVEEQKNPTDTGPKFNETITVEKQGAGGGRRGRR